jgi:hypothetical protein
LIYPSYFANIQVLHAHLWSCMWYITELLHKFDGSVFKIFTYKLHLKPYISRKKANGDAKS